jgi:hypothetical protein
MPSAREEWTKDAVLNSFYTSNGLGVCKHDIVLPFIPKCTITFRAETKARGRKDEEMTEKFTLQVKTEVNKSG